MVWPHGPFNPWNTFGIATKSFGIFQRLGGLGEQDSKMINFGRGPPSSESFEIVDPTFGTPLEPSKGRPTQSRK